MSQSDQADHSAPRGRAAPLVVNTMATRIAAELPYLRRYARALTGSQTSGDSYAAAAIEALLADRSLLDPELPARIILFRTFHQVWQSTGPALADLPENDAERRAFERLAALTSNTREALLLFTIEEFSRDEVALIMAISPEEADDFLAIAYRETLDALSGRVMIIEDEPLIALDIRSIVEEMGHRVVGVATTLEDAVELGRDTRPDLILSDVQLADNSSGVEAVRILLKDLVGVPAIFITAFPERVLTGEGVEPAFLIAKPFTEERVRSSVSQAMFFAAGAKASD